MSEKSTDPTRRAISYRPNLSAPAIEIEAEIFNEWFGIVNDPPYCASLVHLPSGMVGGQYSTAFVARQAAEILTPLANWNFTDIQESPGRQIRQAYIQLQPLLNDDRPRRVALARAYERELEEDAAPTTDTSMVYATYTSTTPPSAGAETFGIQLTITLIGQLDPDDRQELLNNIVAALEAKSDLGDLVPAARIVVCDITASMHRYL